MGKAVDTGLLVPGVCVLKLTSAQIYGVEFGEKEADQFIFIVKCLGRVGRESFPSSHFPSFRTDLDVAHFQWRMGGGEMFLCASWDC